MSIFDFMSIHDLELAATIIFAILVAWMIVSDLRFQRAMKRAAEADKRLLKLLDQAELFDLNFEMSDEAQMALADAIYRAVRTKLGEREVQPFEIQPFVTRQAYEEGARAARKYIVSGLQVQAKEQGEQT